MPGEDTGGDSDRDPTEPQQNVSPLELQDGLEFETEINYELTITARFKFST
ncbi:hypothetical protein OAX78_00525 [Planctomycetota bacterium]|nr:hypothetical protein [Planctomycetota bacterium]